MKLDANGYCYEKDRCSGSLIYSVDNCDPLYIKFTARITFKVIFDNGVVFDDGNGNRKLEATTGQDAGTLSDGLVVEKCQESLQLFNEGLDKGSDNYGQKPADNEIFNHLDFTSDFMHTARNSVYNSMKVMPVRNDKDPESLGREELERFCEEEISPNSYLSQNEQIDAGKETVSSCPMTVTSLGGHPNQQFKHGKEGAHFDDRPEGTQEVRGKMRSNETTNDDEIGTRKGQRSKPKVDRSKVIKVRKKERGGKETGNENEQSGASKKISKRPDNRTRKLLVREDVKCDFCGVTFDTKLDFFNHRRIKGSSFKCQICGKDELFEAHLIVHNMLNHDDPKKVYADVNGCQNKNQRKSRVKIKCHVCGLVVSAMDSLKTHMNMHTGECLYRCCVCQDQFFSLSSLRYHQETHRVSKRIQCRICRVRFQTRAELCKHKLTHEIICGICGEVFPNKTSRTSHLRLSHPEDVKKCHECFNLFSTDEDLETHMVYHRTSKKEQCPECGIVVTRLKDHLAVHSRGEEKKYACDQCPLKYCRKSSLVKHRLVHTGEKPYACSKCPKRFRTNGTLMRHLSTHTSERPFVCEICGKQFTVRSNLVTHMKIHSGLRKYPCPQCVQTFNYKMSLDIHMKCKHSHTDTLPPCLHCGQDFENDNALKAHIAATHRHTGGGISEAVKQEEVFSLLSKEMSYGNSQNLPTMPFPSYPDQGHSIQIPTNCIDTRITMENPTLHTLLGFQKVTLLEESIPPLPMQSSCCNDSGNIPSQRTPNMDAYFLSPPPTQQSTSTSTMSFHFMPPDPLGQQINVNALSVSLEDVHKDLSSLGPNCQMNN